MLKEENIIGKYNKIKKLIDILKLIEDIHKSVKSIWLKKNYSWLYHKLLTFLLT